MMSNGPAKTYAEHMLSNPNALIHLSSYVAEGTLARILSEAKEGDMVEINGNLVEKRCDFKNTGECSSHATADELLSPRNAVNEQLGLLNQLKIQYLFINHGAFEVKDGFEAYVKENSNIKEENIFQIDRSQVFTIYQLGSKEDEYPTLKVSHFGSKLIKDDEIKSAFLKKYGAQSVMRQVRLTKAKSPKAKKLIIRTVVISAKTNQHKERENANLKGQRHLCL
jgi:hypothetical protein